MNNPIQLIQMMMNGGNPMQMMNQMMGQNPMMKRAMEMSQGKSPDQLKQVCQNLCKERGLDFEQTFNQFQSQLKK